MESWMSPPEKLPSERKPPEGPLCGPKRSEASAFDLVVLGALVGLAVAVSRLPILTPDVWWHLATGGWIWNSGIPAFDPFSYTLGGRAWLTHEWLADWILAGIHSGGGLLGVVYLRGVLLAAAVAVSYRAARLHAGRLTTILLLVPAVYATQRNWLDRPQLWTFLLAPLLLLLLERQRLGRGRALLVLPVLFALWVNLHGGFMLGIALVLLWLVGALLARWTAGAQGARDSLKGLAGPALLAVLATVANPHFVEGALYPLRYVVSGLSLSLQEEKTGGLDSPYAWVHFTLVLALWSTLLLRVRRVAPQHALVGLVLGWLSMPRLDSLALPLSAERHAPLFLLLGTPLLAWQVHELLPCSLQQIEQRLVRAARGRMGWAAGCVVLLGFFWFAARQLPRDGSSEARLLPGRFPVAGAAWLRENPLPGNLINPYRWGGYLAFELWPQYRVWIDSRGDLYGPERIREFELLHWMPAGGEHAVRELLQRYDANVIIWHLLTLDFGALQVHPFSAWLLQSPDWRLVFYDRLDPRRRDHPAGTTAIFLRVDPRNRDLLERHRPVRLPPLPGQKPRRAPPDRTP